MRLESVFFNSFLLVLVEKTTKSADKTLSTPNSPFTWINTPHSVILHTESKSTLPHYKSPFTYSKSILQFLTTQISKTTS